MPKLLVHFGLLYNNDTAKIETSRKGGRTSSIDGVDSTKIVGKGET